MATVSMRDMLKAGVHFGHQTRYWNPKMKPVSYTHLGAYQFELPVRRGDHRSLVKQHRDAR